MADLKGANIDQIVEQIVCISLIDDKTYQELKDNGNERRMLYEKRYDSVLETIDQIANSIRAKMPDGFNLPENINFEIAKQLLTEVQNNSNVIASGFTFDDKSIIKELNIPIRDDINENSKEQIDTSISYAQSLGDMIEEALAEGKLEMHDGSILYIEMPEDSIFACSEAEMAEELEIEYREDEMKEIFEEFQKNPERAEEFTKKFVDEMHKTNGVDSALRFLDKQIEQFGREFITQNEFGKRIFEKIVEKINADREAGVGTNFDNYTTFRIISIMDKVISQCDSKDLSQDEKDNIETKLRIMGPEIYEMFRNNPGVYQEIKRHYGDMSDVNAYDAQNLAIKFAGTSKSISEDRTLEEIDTFIKRNPQCKERTEQLENTEQYERIIQGVNEQKYSLIQPPKKESEDIVQANKKILLDLYKSRGIEAALSCALNNSTSSKLSKKMQELWLQSISEILDQEITEPEESIIRSNEDIIALREQVKTTTTRTETAKYAQITGNALKKILDKQVEQEQARSFLDSDKATEQILEQYGEESDKFGTKNSKTVPEEPDER